MVSISKAKINLLLGPSLADTLLDTSKYSPKLSEGGVVAWPVKHTTANRKKDEREMEFTVRAQVLKVKADGTADDAADDGKDEL